MTHHRTSFIYLTHHHNDKEHCDRLSLSLSKHIVYVSEVLGLGPPWNPSFFCLLFILRRKPVCMHVCRYNKADSSYHHIHYYSSVVLVASTPHIRINIESEEPTHIFLLRVRLRSQLVPLPAHSCLSPQRELLVVSSPFSVLCTFLSLKVIMVWGNQDLWRHHPLISRGYRAAFPGLRTAVPIFAAYLVLDSVFGSAHADEHMGPGAFVREEVGAMPVFDPHASGDDHHGH